MSWLTQTLRSSIGKKFLVAIFGLLLCAYLVVHLFGNLMLFGGQNWFNSYAERLESVPGLILIELGLAAVFLVHILFAVWVTCNNWASAGTLAGRYEVHATKGAKTLANQTMIYTGLFTIVFLIFHVYNVRFEARGEYGLYGRIVWLFSRWWYSAFYIVAMIFLGAHVWHGLQSASRTLGFQHPKYFPFVLTLSKAFGLIVAVGFSSIPIYVMLGLGPWETFSKTLTPIAIEASVAGGMMQDLNILPEKEAQLPATVVVPTLRVGQQIRWRTLELVLARVIANNAADATDDRIEVVARTGVSSQRLSLELYDTQFIGDYQIAARRIRPSGRPGEGSATLEIRYIPPAPVPGLPR